MERLKLFTTLPVAMEFVFRLKDSVVQYLSPTKRRRTIGPGTPSNDAREHAFLIPNSEPQDRKAQAAVFNRINKKSLSPSDTQNPRKRARDVFEDDPNEPSISPDDSISQVTQQGDDTEEASSDGSENGSADSENDEGEETECGQGDVGADADENMEVDAASEEWEEHLEECESEDIEGEGGENELEEAESVNMETDEEENESEDDLAAQEEATAEAKVQEYLARQAELALRREDVEKAKAAGDWHPDEIFLFERLAMRSFEELVPAEWQVDFPTLPQILFSDDLERTFVNFQCVSSYRGVKALQHLLSLGVRVRDRLLTVGRPEKLIAREIKGYIKWSERDGGFVKMRFIPVLTVVSARPKQTTDSISTAITNQMIFLAQKHREHLQSVPEGQPNESREVQKYKRQPPLLYGIIVAQSMVIFVTLDSANPEAKVRHLTHFDFREKDMDVWNGFAIAFMVIAARNYVMSIKDDLEVDDTPDIDEDA